MAAFTKGKWKAGLFEIKCPLCLFNYCCDACSLAQIHEKLGNPSCGKPIACLAACCGFASLQNFWYGTQGSAADSGMCSFAKCCICGSCFVHQQYKEHGCVEGLGPLIMTSYKPSQGEMS
jgi:hypothetical protein